MANRSISKSCNAFSEGPSPAGSKIRDAAIAPRISASAAPPSGKPCSGSPGKACSPPTPEEGSAWPPWIRRASGDRIHPRCTRAARSRPVPRARRPERLDRLGRRSSAGWSRPEETSPAASSSTTSSTASCWRTAPTAACSDLVSTLRRSLRRYLHHYLEQGGRVSLSSLHHSRIAEALRKGDRPAARQTPGAEMASRDGRDRERAPMSRPADPADLSRWRADTPGCERLVHLNNAGAALTPGPVREASPSTWRSRADRRLRGGRSARRGARAEPTPRSLDCSARRPGTWPCSRTPPSPSPRPSPRSISAPGDLILTSRADYASNQIMYLALARRRGVEIIRAPDAPEGGIDPQAVRELVRRRRPARRRADLDPHQLRAGAARRGRGRDLPRCRRPYILDACQAVGQMPVDVSRLHCDYLAGTARKFLRGPRGIGFLYVSDRALAAGAYPLTVDMHGADLERPGRILAHARRPAVRELGDRLRAGAGFGRRGGVCPRRRDRGGAATRSWALARYARERLAAIEGCGCSTGGPRCAPSPRPSWAAGPPGRSSSRCGRGGSTPAHPAGTTR